MSYLDVSFSGLELNSGSANLVFYVALMSVLVSVYWYYNKPPAGLPPGPVGLPVVGYLPFVQGGGAYKKFAEMGAKYGNVFSFYMGDKLAVVLNDYDAIKEAFVKHAEEFSGRPKLPGFDLSEEKFQSLSASDGPSQKVLRRFTLSSLRDLGLGKSSIEPGILEEIEELCKELRKYDGKPMIVTTLLGRSTVNNICAMIFGERFAYDDEFLLHLKALNEEFVDHTDFLAISNFFPSILLIPVINRWLDKRGRLKSLMVEADNVTREVVDKYKKLLNESRWENYINMYLTEKARREAANGQTDTVFTDPSLAKNILLLFGAAGETVRHSIRWGLVYLMNHPEIQRKLQAEIDAQIGSARLPAWSDRTRTPYVEATILELLRISSLLPLNLMHRNVKDVQLCGYAIPKDSFIISNLWNVHHSPKTWTDPEEFKPERFLSESLQLLKLDHLIAFSAGKRQCLGESLARMELYLYFTTMLQQFTFSPALGCDPPSMRSDPKIRFFRVPLPFEVRCIPRHGARN